MYFDNSIRNLSDNKDNILRYAKVNEVKKTPEIKTVSDI